MSLILSVLLLLPLMAEGLSTTCTRSKLVYYTCYKQASETYAQRYETNCGALGWSSCTRYRTATRYVSQASQCSRYEKEFICCPGWSGPSCSIHNLSPTVKSCPPKKTVRASGTGNTYVTWNKPTFEEPHGYNLIITSTHSGESASLSWGLHTVTYTAKSTNNNKEATCAVMIEIKPPIPIVKIQGYSEGETTIEREGEERKFVCLAEYANPSVTFKWFLNENEVLNGVRPYEESSGYLDYRHYFNELILTIDRTHDLLQCKGLQGSNELGVSELYMSVEYDDPPLLIYCPYDQTITSASQYTNVSWNNPIFRDVKGEELTVSCNLPGITETHRTFGFTWGINSVSYTARNDRSGLETVCEFNVNVQTERCQPLTVPTGGALVCGQWSDNNVEICAFMCEDSFDIPKTRPVSEVYICSAAGVWVPPAVSTTCSRFRNPGRDKLPSPLHYYSGDCNFQSVKDAMKNATIQIVKGSKVNEICKYESCALNNMVVKC